MAPLTFGLFDTYIRSIRGCARKKPVFAGIIKRVTAASVAGGKELPLPSRASEAQSTEARTRAEASFKKEQRAKEGAQAMQEYLANNRAIRERTERLKALRLAKEAADKNADPQVPANQQPTPATGVALKRAQPRRMKNQRSR